MKYLRLTRRTVATSLLALLCAGQAHAAGTLTIWINNDKGFRGLQKVADAYASKTGTKVRVMPFNGATGRFEEVGAKSSGDAAHSIDAPAAFEAAMRAGKGPDIWIWPHDRLGSWVKAGWLEPVQASGEFRRDVVQVAWDAFTIGGQVYAYPIAVESVAMIYNKDLVPTPPKSFEEMAALNNKLKTQGKRAIGWETASPYFTWPMLSAGGGYVFQRKIDGTYDPSDTGINHAGAIVGGNMLVQLIKSGVLPEGGMSYQEAEEGMTSGKQAMWITGPWAWDALAKAKINYGVAMLPTVNGKAAKPFVGVLGAMITHTSTNKGAANDFLRNHLLRPEGLAAVNADRPIGVPASKAMFWTLYSDEKIRTSMDTIYNGRPMPNNPEMSLFWKNFSTALSDINNLEKTPKESLDTAATAIRAALPAPAKAPARAARQ
jgi:maltose/maltodextrin transport system substrate-binding protein